MARRTNAKFSEEIINKIAAIISVGVPLHIAAEAVGISGKTVRLWRQKGIDYENGLGRDLDKKYFTFYQKLKKAQAEALIYSMGIIRKAMSKDWKAAKYFIDMTWPSLVGEPLPPDSIVQHNVNLNFIDLLKKDEIVRDEYVLALRKIADSPQE